MINGPTRRAFAAGGLWLGWSAGDAAASENDTDAMSIGVAQAPLHLVEYASTTCPHCAQFHMANWAALKTNYIDTGRVRLTLQEILTPPPQAAFAMFQLARAGSADGPEYFRRVGVLFERQPTIFQATTVAELVTQLVAIGAEWGLTQEQVMASLNDQAGRARIMRSIEAAQVLGVNSTPTFILNGERQPSEFQLSEVMTRTLDAALAR
jgi:protein-disulfide isomerase